ncbi:alginate export family protein [Glycocaulis abyssi]|uniref:Alginate export family protein n=1 Tax=Glycocaulis abyssi TaxID=1433403 RepID=A0ABV9N8W8_9PROT
MKRFLVAGLSGLMMTVSAPAVAAASDEGVSPFTLKGSARIRYESLSDLFRAGSEGSDQMLSSRVRIHGEYDAGRVVFGGEFLDARAWLTDSGSVIPNGSVNAAELLQAYVRIPVEGGTIQAGRFVMNAGSGRLATEQGFRNSPNNFEGVRARFSPAENWAADVFYTAPVRIRPGDRNALENNTAQIDEAEWGTRFWGVHLTRTGLPNNLRLEAYLFGLNEENGADLLTPGLRLTRPRAAGQYDFDLEIMGQTGDQPVGGNTLDVRAWSAHAAAGYTFDAAWSPRLSAQLVYATGDDNPADARWNRFNPMFGGRRGDFGTTGLSFTHFRENLIAFGPRLDLREGPAAIVVQVQESRLASDTDRWRVAGLRDTVGQSGSRIGTLAEVRGTYWLKPDRLQIEAGTMVLFRGEFARTAPGAAASSDPVYGYVMLSAPF